MGRAVTWAADATGISPQVGVEAGGSPAGIVASWDGPVRLGLQGRHCSVSTKALFPLPLESPLFIYPQRPKLFAEHILQGFFHPKRSQMEWDPSLPPAGRPGAW